MPNLKVLSLGWGVQSWTLAAMIAYEEVEPVDVAIHSDTTWERSSTYNFAHKWSPWLRKNGLSVVTVNDSGAHGQIADEWEGTLIPAFTVGPNGERGQLRRQCTGRWKINPLRRYVRELMRTRNMALLPGTVETWLGITTDEVHRAKDSDVKYIRNRYPLLERGMSRADCVGWLERKDLPVPEKSSCVFCPYHSRAAWEQLKREGGKDWGIAVSVDAMIREQRPPYPLFVHPNRIALEDAVSIPEDKGWEQVSMFNIECDSGFCFS